MPTKNVTVEEAGTHLAELIDLVEQGEDVVITSNNKARVKLVPILEATRQRVFGQYQGKIRISNDFDAPLPDSFWLSGRP